jgi:hypothetical protein
MPSVNLVDLEAAIERAAIYEHDAGMTRAAAEAKAAKDYGVEVEVEALRRWKGYAVG